jgi:hypothetical protein
MRINNSTQFFIISVLHQQPEGQLQMQHKGRQNNKYNKIIIIIIVITIINICNLGTISDLHFGLVHDSTV